MTAHLRVKVEDANFARVDNFSYCFQTRAEQLFLVFTVLHKQPVANVRLKLVLRNKMIFTTIHFITAPRTSCVYKCKQSCKVLPEPQDP